MNFIAEKIAKSITNQYLETCPSNAIYTSCTSAESFVDIVNFCFKDTHRENAPSNKTPLLTKSTNMGIWVVGTSNQLFI